MNQMLVGEARAQRNFPAGWLVKVMVKGSSWKTHASEGNMLNSISVIDSITHMVDLF